MNTPAPSYLRLHKGDTSPKTHASGHSATENFWRAFSAATGWRIDRQHPKREVDVQPVSDVKTDCPTQAATETNVEAEPDSRQNPAIIRENAHALARSADAMAQDIEQLQSLVRRQEIELAAHAATQFSASDAEAMSEAIQTTLQSALSATGFDAAAIYMLDDDTEHLVPRVVIGLPDSRLGDTNRSLRGSRADLEAMVQDVVLIEDLLGYAGETWNSPEPFGAAICASIKRGDLPVGTLWLFAREPRELGATDESVARLCSRQLTLELATAGHQRRAERAQESCAAINEIANWQYTSLPADNLLAPGWMVDGMIESPQPWSAGWHAWDVLPDGSLMLAIAESEDKGASGAMTAATARAALAAHCSYRHRPEQMLQRISDTLWNTNTAEQLVSMLYARIDPETGEGTVVSCGQMQGLIAGSYGYRPLIKTGAQPLASCLDVDFFESTFQLATNETLVAYGEGFRTDGIRQDLIGCTLRTASRSEGSALANLRREFAAFPVRNERSMVAISHRSP